MVIDKSSLVKRILNEQFRIIGADVKFETLEEQILVGKKKVMWYDYYKFENKEQYQKWKEWALKELEKSIVKENFDKIDMLWGLCYKWKEGD